MITEEKKRNNFRNQLTEKQAKMFFQKHIFFEAMKEKNTLVILDIHKEIERETRGREYEGG